MTRVRAWVRAHPRWTIAGAVVVFLTLLYVTAAGAIAASLFASRASEKLGKPVSVGRGRGGLGAIVFDDVSIAGAPGKPALCTMRHVRVPLLVAVGARGPIRIEGLRIAAVRGGGDDNVSDIIDRLRGGKGQRGADKANGDSGGTVSTDTSTTSTGGGSSAGASAAKLPDIVIEDAKLEARDDVKHLSVTVGSFDGELKPGVRFALRLRAVRGQLAIGDGGAGPSFGADEIDVQTPLDGLRPKGDPSVRINAGRASPLPSLSLTGITGIIAPPPAGVPGPADGLIIDLRGSYGGAQESLWTAKGRADLTADKGTLAVRAEQFSLGRIKDVLPRSVLTPDNTTMDAALDLAWAGDAVRFAGDLAVVGLSLHHESLSAEPIENVSLGLTMKGTAYPVARRLELERAEARIRDITARLAGSLAMPSGTFNFTNGKTMDVVPKIEISFTVPKVPCAKVLASVPPALLPRLQGFVLQGNFAADVGAKIDYANLDALALTGKIAIDGCKVLKAPPEVLALAGNESLLVNVEVPKKLGAPPGSEPDILSHVIGPDNPDFVPYEEISPHLTGSIMTTEDNGFFKHRGWISSQFTSALRRNLQRGGFRLGASSITMQMTKNVLLTKEKTLSRKVQELFLVWYLEQILPKERILELYFNAIEFGPRIYGIGAATRHYFGKKPSELTPLEAAFFSSIMPNPKRRYIQYCHGAPLAQWDKYIHRIMAKTHERGRLTPEEYAEWAVETLKFDRKEATFTEKQCMEWVKTMAPKPEPEAPPDLEDAGGDGGGASAAEKRLRKLYASKHAGAPGAAAKPAAAKPGVTKPIANKSVATPTRNR